MTYLRWIGMAMVALAVGALSPATGWSSLKNCGADHPHYDPLSLYGDELIFSVLRNGEPIGTHRVTFDREGDRLVVDSRFEAEVKFLFITAFEYLYQSKSVWRDGCMVELNATTDDNGNRSRVTARLADSRLVIDGPSGRAQGNAGLFPTDHWHSGVLGSDQVLNTITGRVASVSIADLGETRVRVDKGSVPARHYVYSGDLRTEVWYDTKGRWVKMRFRAKDGSTVEYVCKKCGAEGTSDPAS